MPQQPAISVLMATHNDGNYLPAAVRSILGQSVTDLELIIIDDGSTDQTTSAYLDQLSDPRVRIVRQSNNLGLTRSLNTGLRLCRGQFIARMDADDVSLPHRLQTQWACLQADPSLGVVGSSRLLVDAHDQPLGVATVMPDDLSIRWKCLLGNPLPHPTVMLRAAVLREHRLSYDETFGAAQDYALWSRLLPLTRAANIVEPLVRYRLHDLSISQRRREEQLINHDRIALSAQRRLLPDFETSAEVVSGLRRRYGGASVTDPEADPADSVWLAELRRLFDAFVAAHASDTGLGGFLDRQHRWIDGFARRRSA